MIDTIAYLLLIFIVGSVIYYLFYIGLQSVRPRRRKPSKPASRLEEEVIDKFWKDYEKLSDGGKGTLRDRLNPPKKH